MRFNNSNKRRRLYAVSWEAGSPNAAEVHLSGGLTEVEARRLVAELETARPQHPHDAGVREIRVWPALR